MNPPVLVLDGVRKSFGPVEIIRGVSLEVGAHERHAVIGPNGAGKSTLFHLISGQLRPSAGGIRLAGRSIAGHSPQAVNRLGLARSFQITNLFPQLTVFENIRLAVMRSHGLQYCFWRLIDRNGPVRERSESLLESVRLSHRAATAAGELSYSEQRSLEIAMTLASDPRIILLDEPSPHQCHEQASRRRLVEPAAGDDLAERQPLGGLPPDQREQPQSAVDALRAG